ncbi:cytochrome c [Sphingomonas sp. JC676]|uniref:c-type cytochrome n=1 Tax=Sphingomonas sp. JC676 TaxID=2768065 RepID=UPI0016586289|nr:cytochrome c [Sphingomonas sp. JC676]MBC9032306.1 cytochrome c [Sphingomonas sp. JC676]
MSARRIVLIVLAAIVVVGAGMFAWIGFGPGPMAFAGGRAVTLAEYKAGSPTGVPADFASADPVERGKYLTIAADCQACHTAPGGTPFAGGRAFNLPFGTIWSPNITPDKKTGIGGWSDAQFLAALREGKGPKAHLYPAMPYASYTFLTDADALAIRAYLKTLAPVHQQRPKLAFSWPFNQRWLMTFWSGLFNPNQRFRPNADRSPEWNRGAYLAEALGHCGECHTPRNIGQAMDNRSKYAGAVAAGWRAFNITGDKATGVGGWSDADLAQYLSQGHAPGHGTAAGPMREAIDLSLSKLTKSDIAALVTYLRTIPAVSTPGQSPSPAGPAPATHAVAAADDHSPLGKKIFEGACIGCHAWNGKGALTGLATLTGSSAVNDPEAINVAQVIIQGASARTPQGQSVMPAFGHAYSDAEIAAVANYVTARFGAKPSSITAKDVAALRKAE